MQNVRQDSQSTLSTIRGNGVISYYLFKQQRFLISLAPPFQNYDWIEIHYPVPACPGLHIHKPPHPCFIWVFGSGFPAPHVEAEAWRVGQGGLVEDTSRAMRHCRRNIDYGLALRLHLFQFYVAKLKHYLEKKNIL